MKAWTCFFPKSLINDFKLLQNKLISETSTDCWDSLSAINHLLYSSHWIHSTWAAAWFVCMWMFKCVTMCVCLCLCTSLINKSVYLHCKDMLLLLLTLLAHVFVLLSITVVIMYYKIHFITFQHIWSKFPFFFCATYSKNSHGCRCQTEDFMTCLNPPLILNTMGLIWGFKHMEINSTQYLKYRHLFVSWNNSWG